MMKTRISLHKDGQVLLDIAVDCLLFHAMNYKNMAMPEMPYSIQVHSPLGDEIRLVTEDDL